METKVCTVCGTGKPLDQYRKYSGRGKNGLRPLCKICQRNYERQWRSTSKDYRQAQRSRHKANHPNYPQEYRERNRAKYLVASCKTRAIKMGLPFDLEDHLFDLQQRIDHGICEVSGVKLASGARKGRTWNSPSIDQITPRAGYVYDNIRIVAFAVNAMLGDWGESVVWEIFKSWKAQKGS